RPSLRLIRLSVVRLSAIGISSVGLVLRDLQGTSVLVAARFTTRQPMRSERSKKCASVHFARLSATFTLTVSFTPSLCRNGNPALGQCLNGAVALRLRQCSPPAPKLYKLGIAIINPLFMLRALVCSFSSGQI